MIVGICGGAPAAAGPRLPQTRPAAGVGVPVEGIPGAGAAVPGAARHLAHQGEQGGGEQYLTDNHANSKWKTY